MVAISAIVVGRSLRVLQVLFASEIYDGFFRFMFIFFLHNVFQVMFESLSQHNTPTINPATGPRTALAPKPIVAHTNFFPKPFPPEEVEWL